MASSVYIEGPVSFSEYYHPALKKHVYLFGDIHTTRIRCSSNKVSRLPFHRLVTKMIRDKPSVVDVFVESSFIADEAYPKKIESGDYILSAFRKTFSPCLQYSKKTCKRLYPNARFHYTDVRDFFPTDVITAIYNIDTPHPALFWIIRNHYEDVINVIYDTNHRTEKVMDLMKINKQLDAIPNADMRQVVRDYFDRRLAMYRVGEEVIRRISSNLESIRDNPESLTPAELLGTMEGAHDNIMKTLALYFDYYTVCRLLRSFSDGTNIKTCIIYEGENHAEEHRNILSNLGFELLNISVSLDQTAGSENFQCIRIPHMNSFLGRRMSIRNALQPVYESLLTKTDGIITLSKRPVRKGLFRIVRLSKKGTFETLE